jgi:hypothetical protein
MGGKHLPSVFFGIVTLFHDVHNLCPPFDYLSRGLVPPSFDVAAL